MLSFPPSRYGRSFDGTGDLLHDGPPVIPPEVRGRLDSPYSDALRKNVSQESTPASQLLRIEYLCEKFLASGDCRVESLEDFLTTEVGHPEMDPHASELLYKELLSTTIESAIGAGTCVPEQSFIASKRMVVPHWSCSQRFRDAVLLEFEIRSLVGDKPRVTDFSEWCGGKDVVAPLELDSVIAEIAPVEFRVLSKQHANFTRQLTGPTIFGRQMRCDPPPICFIDADSNHGARVIVSAEMHVSRTQLSLSRPSVNTYRITNLGSKQPLYIDSAQKIEPGTTYECSSFTLVEFSDISIRVAEEDVYSG